MPVALVTGASRGIGKAIAEALAPSHSLLLVGRSVDRLAAVTDQCLQLGAAEVVPLAADLSESTASDVIAGQVKDRFGRLDVLVNNAGIAVTRVFGEYTSQDWESVMAVNARTPFFLTQALLPLLRKPPVSWIINIASAVAKRGYASQSLYAASKHALLGMTKSIARDLAGSGIRVHALLPGGVDTPMIREIRPDIDVEALIRPAEVGGVILSLLSMQGNAMIDEIEIRRREKPAWS